MNIGETFLYLTQSIAKLIISHYKTRETFHRPWLPSGNKPRANISNEISQMDVIHIILCSYSIYIIFLTHFNIQQTTALTNKRLHKLHYVF